MKISDCKYLRRKQIKIKTLQKSEDMKSISQEKAATGTSQQIDHSKAAQIVHVPTVDSKELTNQDETVLSKIKLHFYNGKHHYECVCIKKDSTKQQKSEFRRQKRKVKKTEND